MTKKVTKGFAERNKPLFIALIVIGSLGLLAGGIGLTGFGAHQGWWSSAINFTQLSSDMSFNLTAVGGGGLVCLILGIAGLAKAHHDKPKRVNRVFENLSLEFKKSRNGWR